MHAALQSKTILCCVLICSLQSQMALATGSLSTEPIRGGSYLRLQAFRVLGSPVDATHQELGRQNSRSLPRGHVIRGILSPGVKLHRESSMPNVCFLCNSISRQLCTPRNCRMSSRSLTGVALLYPLWLHFYKEASPVKYWALSAPP